MKLKQLRYVCVVILAGLGFCTGVSSASAKPPAKPAKPPAKPKPKPHPAQAHRPAPTHAMSTVHRLHHNHYAGRSGHSRAWYHHHMHRRWVYEVRYRSLAWHARVFRSRPAAHTFFRYLGFHHFERRLHHPAEGVWDVAYRSGHTHHYGTYAALPVARRVEGGLRASGFSAWLRWHRRYF